jgi:hypothetical protein
MEELSSIGGYHVALICSASNLNVVAWLAYLIEFQ